MLEENDKAFFFVVRRAATLLLSGALLMMAPGPAQAQEGSGDPGRTRDVDKSGTTAAAFLMIPVGARATAMGSAYSAIAEEASTMYWNPAGLSNLDAATFTGEYAVWLVELDFSYAGLALPTRLGTFGLNVTALRSPEMDVTREDVPGYRTGETFRANSYAVGLSYGRALTDRFSIGGTVKLVRETISASAATGVAFDVGTLFITPFRDIRLGASITNFGTKMKMRGDDLNVRIPDDVQDGLGSGDATGRYNTNSYDLPITMRIGLAGEVWEAERSRLTLAVDALHPNDNDEFINVGAEVGLLNDLLMLRGGYSELFLNTSDRSWTLGGGLRYRFGDLHFAADYAYETYQEYFSGVNRLTFSLKL